MTKHVEMDFIAPITTRRVDRYGQVASPDPEVPVYWGQLGTPIGKATNILRSPDGKSVSADVEMTAEQAAQMHQFSMGANLASVVRPSLTPEETARIKADILRGWGTGEPKPQIVPEYTKYGTPWPRWETPPADVSAVVQFTRQCPDCNGSGQYVGLNEVETCRTCNGSKVVTP